MYSPWVAFCAGGFFLRGVGGLRRSFTARRTHEIIVGCPPFREMTTECKFTVGRPRCSDAAP
eukprot:1198361-Prymnesium_polylepis.1